ncbi:MAG: sulfotransferase domain-containing protein [Phycisphaerales bacterium]|nr:sulfotransferase domain-containing protein [Phycisphaerales bacterium]
MGDSVSKIQFAIAGVQKAGTTALAQYLDQHAKLYLPPTKELHIFRNYPITEDKLTALIALKYKMAPRSYSNGPLWGEATPLYMYWPHAFELMALHNSNMKIIISLRHPVARAYSGWSMEIRRGREFESFSYCIRDGRERVSSAPNGVHLRYSYVERGFYAAQIRRLLSIFPRENVFFLRADQIRHDDLCLQNILEFLDVVPLDFIPITKNVFPSSLLKRPENLVEDFVYLQDIYKEDLRALSGLTGLDFSDWIIGPPVL